MSSKEKGTADMFCHSAPHSLVLLCLQQQTFSHSKLIKVMKTTVNSQPPFSLKSFYAQLELHRSQPFLHTPTANIILATKFTISARCIAIAGECP